MAKEIGNNELIETWGSAGNVVEPSVGKITGGWTFEEQPPHEYMNWIHNKLGQQINYLMRSGIPSWNPATSYTTGSAVIYNSAIWIASEPNTNSEPQASNTDWVGFDASLFAPAARGVPSGAVQAFAMQLPPTGWLKCDGSLVAQATYPDLFSAIGTTFGAGDGTNFRLPDLRGYFARGWDDGRGADPNRAFGSSQLDAFEEHTHTLVGNDRGENPSQKLAPGLYQDDAENPNTDPGSIRSAGGANETRPKNVALLYCIKV